MSCWRSFGRVDLTVESFFWVGLSSALPYGVGGSTVREGLVSVKERKEENEFGWIRRGEKGGGGERKSWYSLGGMGMGLGWLDSATSLGLRKSAKLSGLVVEKE